VASNERFGCGDCPIECAFHVSAVTQGVAVSKSNVGIPSLKAIGLERTQRSAKEVIGTGSVTGLLGHLCQHDESINGTEILFVEP